MGSFNVRNNNGDIVPGSVQYDPATKTATWTPGIQLAPNSQYSVELTSQILDATGNSLQPINFSFTTGTQVEEPMVISHSPTSGQTGVVLSKKISTVFNVAMDASTIQS